ncbi:uncharacterized protein [Hetaerina americana]|uniref:uncharacterized protein isoform X2 n=1 Tax=Hetaerina americana TaxID=62018 RepID=UPI003A7F31B5
MCDKAEFELCRLCLNSSGVLINVFGDNSELQFMLEYTIEDLLDVKVVEDTNYPWLVCSNCMEKLTEFRLFKRRCAECFSEFYNRIQEGCNPTATKDWMSSREELGSEMKTEMDDKAIDSDAVDSNTVDVQDDMIYVKEENDTASDCSVAAKKEVDLPMFTSMLGGDRHWSGNDEARNLDPPNDGEIHLFLNEEVDIKEECNADIPHEGGCLGVNLLQEPVARSSSSGG